MLNPTLKSPASPLTKRNIYAVLSPISAGLAFLGNCLNLFAMIIPGIAYICAVINGAFSLGALVTGAVGLAQIRRSPDHQKGRALAVTGIVCGLLGLLAACLIPLLGTTILGALGLKIGDLLLVPVE